MTGLTRVQKKPMVVFRPLVSASGPVHISSFDIRRATASDPSALTNKDNPGCILLLDLLAQYQSYI